MISCKLKDVFVQVNAGALLLHGCLLVSSILLSLRLDGVVLWSLGIIFLPLWIWNVVLMAAFVVGSVVWCKQRETYRYDPDHRAHCCSMCITFILLMVVIVGEVFIVAAGDTGMLPWRAAFTPFYLLFILSCSVCFWSVWKCRSCELEALSLMSFIQLVLLGVRLDQVSLWSWAVTLIPTWLSVCILAVVLVVYSIAVPLWQRKHQWLTPEGQTGKVKFPFFVVTASAALSLFAVFLILLVVRLDAQVGIPFGAIFIPLHLCILVISANELTRDWAGNPWWFGIRQSYGEFVLQKSAVLQELVNVSYVKEDLLPPSSEAKAVATEKKTGKKQTKTHLVGTLESLYMPD